jgi:Sulfotransferase family
MRVRNVDFGGMSPHRGTRAPYDVTCALPNTFIIGAPKAGTTSLAAWLADHPQVFFSTPKEPYYWASDYPNLRAHYGFATLDAYAGLFSREETRHATHRAEGSTVYLYSETAVPDILNAVPLARFVVCLRNPVDLLASYHRTEVVTLNEREADFECAWRLRAAGSLTGADPIDPKLVDYPRVGRLGAAVGRLLRHVPREQVHFIVFDDLTHDPGGEWHKLTDFLSLPQDNRRDFTARNPSDSMFRWRLLRQITHRPPESVAGPMRVLRQWSRETDNTMVQHLKAATWRPEAKPSMSRDLRAELMEYFADDVRSLGGFVGRDLAAWTTSGPY